MTKGLPWTVEEEIQLKNLMQAKTPISAVAATLRRTPQAIFVKCQRLGIEATGYVNQPHIALARRVAQRRRNTQKTRRRTRSSNRPWIKQGRSRAAQVMATLARAYKEILADYLNYREIEEKLNDMEAKYAALFASKNNASQPVPTPMATTPAQ